MFGLKEAEVAQLVRAVSVDEPDRDRIEERFARATWTGIAEPGDRIAWAAVDAIGAARALAALVEQWTARAFAEATGVSEQDATKALERWQPRVRSAPALVAMRQAARFGVRLRIPGEPGWPDGLIDLEAHAALALWTRGSDDAVRALGASIALVGARAATGYGEHVTMEASAGLVDRGYAIVSGAAYGIDGAAHRAALATGGVTIAFLAGGVDRFYPSGHDALLTRIVEHGAVVSELPCGAAPTRWRFLQRNRLIAAASRATVVLEAGWRSGSLNTAYHAAQVGRPLGAVPGPVTSAASAGCHRLIRELLATCVTSAEEMAELAPLELLSSGPARTPTPVGPLSSERPRRARRSADDTRVLDALSATSPRDVDDLAMRSGMSVHEVRAELGRLELEGEVRERGGGWAKRPPKRSQGTADDHDEGTHDVGTSGRS